MTASDADDYDISTKPTPPELLAHYERPWPLPTAELARLDQVLRKAIADEALVIESGAPKAARLVEVLFGERTPSTAEVASALVGLDTVADDAHVGPGFENQRARFRANLAAMVEAYHATPANPLRILWDWDDEGDLPDPIAPGPDGNGVMGVREGPPASGYLVPPAEAGDPFRDGRAEITANLLTMEMFNAIHDAGSKRNWDDGGGQHAPTHITITNRGAGYVRTSIRGDDGEPLPPTGAIPAMWSKVDALGDGASDALCVCLALAEQRGRGPDTAFWITADAILDARGVKRMTKAGEPGNWQHGHRREDRIAAGRWLAALQHVWLEADVEITRTGPRKKARRLRVNSRALAITDETTQQELDGGAMFLAARVVLGSWAASYWDEGLRQVALLAKRALEYDPYREQPEKRLAKYLAFQFKFDAKHGRAQVPCRVETLLRRSSITINATKPQRTRDRLEQALNRLRDDEVIAAWEYALDADAAMPAKNWLGHWLRRSTLVTMPAAVEARYRRGRLRPATGGPPQ